MFAMNKRVTVSCNIIHTWLQLNIGLYHAHGLLASWSAARALSTIILTSWLRPSPGYINKSNSVTVSVNVIFTWIIAEWRH